MRHARSVRLSCLALAFVLGGIAGGCGPGSSTVPGPEEAQKIDAELRQGKRARYNPKAAVGKGARDKAR
jgi:hypothetical protein